MRNLRAALVAAVALAGTAILTVGVPAQAAHSHARPHAGGTLTVFAAASLQEAFTTIGKRFDAANGSTTRFSFGGSDTLATQITQGAPADVFASANQAQMTVVVNKGLVASTPKVFVRNRLVVIVPKNNPGHVYSLPDLGRPGLRLVLAAPAVPVGKYARAAFAVMANDAAFGTDFLARIKANTVSNETDVKAVAAKVELGEADAGVVYVTDVTKQVASKVTRIDVPAPYNQLAIYPIAALKGSHNAALARKFVAYVTSPAGLSVLKDDRFITTAPAGGPSSAVQVSGLVVHPQTLTVAALKRMPAATVTVTKRTDVKVLGMARYTGVLLDDVIQAAVPLTNTSFKNDMLRQFATVGATDNYQVSVALAEILPQFGHERVLLAYAKNGKPLPASEGAIELIVPGDALAGRDVTNVNRIVVGTPLGNL